MDDLKTSTEKKSLLKTKAAATEMGVFKLMEHVFFFNQFNIN